MKIFIFHTVLCLAPAVGVAYDLGPFINEEMKKVDNQAVLQEDLGTHYQQEGQLQEQNLQLQKSTSMPLSSTDASILYLDSTRGEEQAGASLQRPQTGFVKTVDPASKIQEELAQKDHQNKIRNNYRKAVQKEFMRRALQEGIVPDRNIAEELKQLESRSAR